MAELVLPMQISKEALEFIIERNGEPVWVQELRYKAWDVFEQTPMPTPKDEEWRRTDLKAFRLTEYLPISLPNYDGVSSLDVLPNELQVFLHPGSEEGNVAGLLVHHGSKAVYRWLSDEVERKGVIFTDIATALREHSDLLNGRLHQLVLPSENKFVALHAALMNSGAFVYVPPRVRLELPLHLFFWLDAERSSLFDHLLIVADRESEVIVMAHYASPQGEFSALSSGAVEIFAEPSSQVYFISLQEWGNRVYDFHFVRANIRRDAYMRWVLTAFGGKLWRVNCHSKLVELGASTDMLGMSVGSGIQQFDHHTFQEHVAPQCKSDLLFKVVLMDRASSIYRGLIKVHKNAQGTDAYQANRNLLLSPKAKADSMPLLEIEANEVRCTHGATIGRVDEHQLFYLMSRGIARRQAEKIIVDGFLRPVIDKVPVQWFGEKMQELLDAKMLEEAKRLGYA
ncbi:MAG: Fe-S cluster assembly protein SufD [Armatimonadetes bacterium]|nr:Fe-S cluster assembly protein SufD [Armatimonadota bacterium]MDW8028143.1 Fe-S cluster assembly protein SufD [Armatimonadota bacterium]